MKPREATDVARASYIRGFAARKPAENTENSPNQDCNHLHRFLQAATIMSSMPKSLGSSAPSKSDKSTEQSIASMQEEQQQQIEAELVEVRWLLQALRDTESDKRFWEPASTLRKTACSWTPSMLIC